MDTNINHLIECISDSIKKKGEEIANLKRNIKSFETNLETYEDRIKKLEEENKRLCEDNKVLYEERMKNTEKSVNDRVKAAYNDGYGAAIGKMVAFVNKIKFDSAFNTKQDQGTLKKALAADYGKCYFKVYNYAPIRDKLNIIGVLKDIYNVSVDEIKSYLESLPINGCGNIVLLDKVSDTTCKKLREALRNVRIECDYFSI
jgi:hypothetical protein